ncbi:MAG: RNA methyltransferase, partial [Actinomycetia bacterium]|nr:RNA methyltransferase [Actinomycetes bacterium]
PTVAVNTSSAPRCVLMKWVRPGKEAWVRNQRSAGHRIVAIELVEDALPLSLLDPAREPTVLLLGHEHHGLPGEIIDLADDVVEIPMIGRGASLNVAVAGSLVLYRLAGLS